eukprot:TRINITY_DN8517_c0_g1_i10.p1 TRINITY_DN8517_c0_g1~~TRINITY_DN8517_c0_g1_i10.p1  ORF type:complete len:106 (-),score=17.70 TRINITY_DN8517_c0_g1_i10:53-370(-)
MFDDPFVSHKPESKKSGQGPITWASLNLAQKQSTENEKLKETKEPEQTSEESKETQQVCEELKNEATAQQTRKPKQKKRKYKPFGRPKVIYVKKTPQTSEQPKPE